VSVKVRSVTAPILGLLLNPFLDSHQNSIPFQKRLKNGVLCDIIKDGKRFYSVYRL
jgi:hypothetical protein